MNNKNIIIKNILFIVFFIISGIFILIPARTEGKFRSGFKPGELKVLSLDLTSTQVFKTYRYDFRTDYRIIEHHSNHYVKSGESFYVILSKAGIPGKDISIILKKIKKYFNPSRIRKGSKYVVTRNGKQEFLKFEYYLTSLKKINVQQAKNTWSVDVEEIPVEIQVDAIAGTLKNSLYASIIKLGEKETLVYDMVDIFQWDIDFYVDPRNGDEFEILFEKQYVKGKFYGYGRILTAHYKGPMVGDNYAYYYAYDKKDGYFKKDGNSCKSQFQKSPLKYTRISSGYSNRRYHPVLKIYRPHRGIDYAAPIGTPVKTVADGKVVYAGWKGQAGKVVIIQHKNGYRSSYGHLHRIPKGIKKGKYVKQGQIIGYVGKTGLATGPHLDFRIKKNGKFINPLKLKKIPSSPVPKKYKNDFFSKRDDYDDMLQDILKKKYSTEELLEAEKNN